MRRLLIIPVIALLLTPVVRGQGEIDEELKMLFTDESSFGAFLQSNGLGVNYRYTRFINARNNWILDADFNYLKDPKEMKSMVIYDYFTKRFVYGKKNLFWELKAFGGRQHELFSKYDRSSISVRAFYSGGITLGFEKPIYYEILTVGSLGEIIDTEEKKFDPSIHETNYGGRASFFKGFNELRVMPGLSVKAGLSFEYSERQQVINALEAGIGASIYPRKIEIMASEQNQFYYFHLYVGYRFGAVIDISESARAKNWLERRRERQEAMDQLPPAAIQ